jgi:hypothetical protein
VNPTEHPNHPKQRFLTYGAPTGRFEQGYAEEAKLGMRAEPECLDENDWDRHIGKPAGSGENSERAADRARPEAAESGGADRESPAGGQGEAS